MSWRTGALLREALLNLDSSVVRTGVLILVTTLALAVLAFLELRQSAEIAGYEQQFAAHGGFVAVVEAAGGQVLDAGRCNALQYQPGIVAAGGMRKRGTVRFTSAPDATFNVVQASGGVLRVWSSRTAARREYGGLVVASALARELGIREGSTLTVEGEAPRTVDAVLDMEHRNPESVRWFLEETPAAGTIDQCWVEFTRGAYGAGLGMLSAWFTSGDREANVRPFLRQDEFSRNTTTEFSSRPQRLGWLAVGALSGMVFLLVGWFRRADLGLYLSLGTGRVQLLTLLVIETFVIVAIAFGLAISWALALEALADDRLPWDHVKLAARSAGMGALVAAITGSLGSAAAGRGNIAAMLKER